MQLILNIFYNDIAMKIVCNVYCSIYRLAFGVGGSSFTFIHKRLLGQESGKNHEPYTVFCYAVGANNQRCVIRQVNTMQCNIHC